MIKGIGNDIIEISRIEKAILNKRFLEKYFTLNENKLFETKNYRGETIAGNFAVKEAVSKVLGTGFVNFTPIDVEVLRDDKGKPYVVLYNGAKDLARQLDISMIHVSISHSRDNVTAIAVGE
ncbi:holo-ACP synthase [Vallitalea guaymasensis]|uniref:holo-ACP synthase n=1 Tax=Vallitalea guaymasensis TaxID=1185412 RepID=UPI000DE34A07|nr:holo-ACP synthase [Vallitalea guaymasensis]